MVTSESETLCSSPLPSFALSQVPHDVRPAAHARQRARAAAREKQAKNRTPNFHFFDLTRGYVGGEDKLTKKSGCYLGKLRANAKHTENVPSARRATRPSSRRRLHAPARVAAQGGRHPRRMAVVLPPPPAADGTPANRAGDALVDMLAKPDRMKAEGYSSLEQGARAPERQLPARLQGRVIAPSVKNFQLVIEGRQQDDAIASSARSATTSSTSTSRPRSTRCRRSRSRSRTSTSERAAALRARPSAPGTAGRPGGGRARASGGWGNKTGRGGEREGGAVVPAGAARGVARSPAV